MEKLVPVLTALFSLLPVLHSNKGLQCTNDYLHTVTCSWNSSAATDPSVDCWISGVKKVFVRGEKKFMTRSCQLKQDENSPPGCSLVFENREFSKSEKMPNISVKCNGTLLETIQNYIPSNHIKMHPPSAPQVRSTANGTWIYWSQGHDVSIYLTFEFQVQLKKKEESWERAYLLHSDQQDQTIALEELKGDVQLRVRVKPINRKNSQWSDWSPTTSWTGPPDEVEPPENEEWWLHQMAVISMGLLLPLCVIICALLFIYRSCKSRGLVKEKPIPNPSEYLNGHEGNLKDWLNPLRVSDSFFTSQPCEQISRVEVCEDRDSAHRDSAPSSPPPSGTTRALLHLHHQPSGGSQTSGDDDDDDDSSSSSCFSNMGYFMSSSSGGSAHTDFKMAYFTYQDESCALQPFVFPSLTVWRAYESLKKEQHSPDSGFCTGKDDELDIDLGGEEDLEEFCSQLLTLPLHLPLQMCPLTRPLTPPTPPTPLTPPHPVGVAPTSSDLQQVEFPAMAAGGGGSAARVVPGAACRPSSMPVEPHKTGYVTLKELQMTFSNKSI